MAVSRKAMTEGIRTPIFLCALIDAVLQSLSQKSKIFASSLYTREPGCSRTSAFIDVSQKNKRIVPHLFFDSLSSLPLPGEGLDVNCAVAQGTA